MTTEVAPDSLDFICDFYNHFDISKPRINDTCRPHPKFSKFSRDFKDHQERRRKEFFDNLKKQRERLLDKFRPILDYCDDEEMSAESANDSSIKRNANQSEECEMQVDRSIKSSRKPRNKVHRSDFGKLISKQLMLSEWLVEVPEDFYTNWYLVCCPRGKRTLVIASKGRTKVYSRTGYFLFEFKSILPGGCSQSCSNQNIMTKSSILDCIYVEAEHRFYILDVLTWNGCSFYDCETEFRFYWLHSNFEDKMEILPTEQSTMDVDRCEKQSISKVFTFSPLPYQDCTRENVLLHTKGPYSFPTEIDGILFYHKRAPYTPGITPLVCWLKLHMIANVLNISVEN